MLLEEVHRSDQRNHRVVLVHLGMQLARRVFARRRAADQREQVRRVGEEALDREAAGDVFKMRIEAAVLVDHQHDGTLALGLGAGEIAVDLALGRVIGEPLGHEPRVALGNDRRLRVVVLQDRQQRGGSGRGAGQRGELVEEVAAAHAAVGKVVVEIDDALVHDGLPGCASEHNTGERAGIPARSPPAMKFREVRLDARPPPAQIPAP